jgi:hypothetical protein
MDICGKTTPIKALRKTANFAITSNSSWTLEKKSGNADRLYVIGTLTNPNVHERVNLYISDGRFWPTQNQKFPPGGASWTLKRGKVPQT